MLENSLDRKLPILLISQNINCKAAYENACIIIKLYSKMHGMQPRERIGKKSSKGNVS